MITIKVRPDNIAVRGHASNETSKDSRVCAAVSALTLTLLTALEELAHEDISYRIAGGDTVVRWQRLSDRGKDYIDAWFLGICRIAEDNGYIIIE